MSALKDANQKIDKKNKALFITHVTPINICSTNVSDTVTCSTNICFSLLFHFNYNSSLSMYVLNLFVMLLKIF